MDAIMRRLPIPTAEGLDRNKAKIAGFAAGLLLPLVVVSVFLVGYSGYGLSETPTQPAAPVYPNW